MLTTTSERQPISASPRRSSNLTVSFRSGTVSLIIVNYNACDCIVACVSSAINQVDEVIVVDNASSDGSVAQLQDVFSGDRRLKIVRNRENLGFAAGCNIGVDFSAGSHLLFLNPDCVLAPDSVKRLLRVLDDRRDVGMVGGLLVNPDGTEQAGGGGPFRHHGDLLSGHSGCRVLRIDGHACFLIFTCTSSRCRLTPLRSRPFPVRACWSTALRCEASGNGTRAIFSIVKIWICP